MSLKISCLYIEMVISEIYFCRLRFAINHGFMDELHNFLDGRFIHPSLMGNENIQKRRRRKLFCTPHPLLTPLIGVVNLARDVKALEILRIILLEQ